MLCAGTMAAAQTVSLKDAYKGKFVVGAAINTPQITGQDVAGDAIITGQFNSISPENVLKWEVVHPQPDKYDFDLSDKYVAFGEQHHMYIVGHTLVWHSQTPDWVFHDAKGNQLSREALLERMRSHIRTVVGRYKGRIQSWDVVNEALEEDGSLRQSPWLKIIGPDFIEKAFQFAHEADPSALLNYNDYNLENAPKRKGAIALVKALKAKGIPVACVGIQAHGNLDWPSAGQMDAAISELSALGVKVAITELDLSVLPTPGTQPTADVSYKVDQDPKLNPYAAGLPLAVEQKLTARYGELFQVFAKHSDSVSRVTLWGVSDADSWLNDWPVRGRTNYPLLFDRNHKAKPAVDAIVRAVAMN
jgi:endo-1,4-beta-xylanase